jgi:transposase InsO family protein
MNTHKNARTTPHLRAFFVQRIRQGFTPQEVATACGVSVRTVYKWLQRHRREAEAGLQNRSSRPRRLRHPTSPPLQATVERLRQERQPMWKIATATGLSRATVARICRQKGLSRLPSLEEKPPIRRYEKAHPGDLIHIDIKKLGKIVRVGHRITGERADRRGKGRKGWEYLHLAVDDHSRLAYSELLPDETRASCIRFLLNALRFYRRHGVAVHRVMTDNGAAFISRRYRKALRMLSIAHKRTRPYTPQTNGKAERFVQTSLREWAYVKPYHTSEERRHTLSSFLHHYNHHRSHFGIQGNTPISRVPVNNLWRHDI